MKRKVWELTVLDNPNRAVGGESDIFYTTDTEAFLIFRLTDEDFNPATATLTLVNTSDKSVISETVPVIDKEIEWEMTEEAIAHSGNWQAQLVYTQEKDGIPEHYTSQVVQFDIQSHLLAGRKPALVAIEDWNTFMSTAGEWLDGKMFDIEQLEQQYLTNETDRIDNEDERSGNEEVRANAESQRELNEDARSANELDRISEESKRATAEGLRKTSEEARDTNETARVTAESVRDTKETERQLSESVRDSSEEVRVSNETERINSEDGREVSETLRVTSESQRELNEDARNSSEQQRESSEQQRESNESLREDSETEREGAEQNRVTAENERNSLYDLVQQKLENGEFIGEKGDTGDGLEYIWNGTQLGVRKKGDTEYVYVDLKGDRGDAGEIENLEPIHIVEALGYIPISANDVPEPTWTNLQNKPTEFNPASHTHGWSEVTDKPTTFAPSTHSHAWSEVTNKPSTFTPSTHTHSINDVTGLRAELDSVPELTKENVGLGNVDNVKQASKVEHDQLVSDYGTLFNVVELTGSNSALNLTVGKTFYQEVSTMVEYSFKAVKDADSFKLILETTDVSYPIIFPENVIWFGNKSPELSQLNSTHILEFLTKDGGVYWYGNVVFRDFEILPTGYVWATDDDFSGEVDGRFRYIGTDVKVAIPHVIKGVPVTSYSNMFNGTGVSGVYSNNSNVTNMESMFRGSSATTLDLSSFDTSNVTNMGYMFHSSSATTLDLSSFDTSNVTNMGYMFRGSSATTLDLSSFDTSNVSNMEGMFYSSSATTLDLSSFDTSNVTNMGYMFRGSSATTLDLSSFDTSSVTSMSYIFMNSSATTLDLSSFDTSNVTSMSNMFMNSSATTGYARTQTDADNLNASSTKPSTLNFIVK